MQFHVSQHIILFVTVMMIVIHYFTGINLVFSFCLTWYMVLFVAYFFNSILEL
jgi:hypothetical protein